jgi:hypothetical protein
MNKVEAMLASSAAWLVMASIFFFCPWLIWRGFERKRARMIAGWGLVIAAGLCLLLAAMFAVIE